MSEEEFVRSDVLDRLSGWQDYAESKLGFCNHWYPIQFSEDIREGEVVGAKVLGERTILK